MKRVYKYATGENIPAESKYLCTQVEAVTEKSLGGTFTKNLFVWHYYEVEVGEDE